MSCFALEGGRKEGKKAKEVRQASKQGRRVASFKKEMKMIYVDFFLIINSPSVIGL